MIGVETIPRIDEAVALCKMLCEAAVKPFYIALCCKEDAKSLNSGEQIEDAVVALQPYFEHESFWAFGVNCCALNATSGLIDRINQTNMSIAGKRKPRLLVYPNSGEKFKIETYTWAGDSEVKGNSFADEAEKWVK